MPTIVMHRPHLRTIPDAPLLPEGYTLRAFGASDDEAGLAAVLTAAFQEPWDEARVRATLTQASDVKAVYVVTSQGQIVATASSRWIPDRFPNTGVVHWVATHPDHEGRGLASALLVRVLNDFIARGYPQAALETQDFRLPAIRLYLRFGFMPVYTVNGEDHRDIWCDILTVLGT